MTRSAFENAIGGKSAIGGSTDTPVHLNGIARHSGVTLDNDWQAIGHSVPLLVNLQRREPILARLPQCGRCGWRTDGRGYRP